MSETTATLNLQLPGNPRYQPKSLQPIFGYDNLMRTVGQVELALLDSLIDKGLIPPPIARQLTDEVRLALLSIPTTEVDALERKIGHDVRAWIQLAKERCVALGASELAGKIHLTLTSYDVLDTANVLRFVGAHKRVVRPLVIKALEQLSEQVERQVAVVQIGRTHGQHALPITVGFWLSTILSRWLGQAQELDRSVGGLCGKVSGAVGAYNAAHALGLTIDHGIGNRPLEEMMIDRLDLPVAPISTQILPPEPLAQYLFHCVLMCAALAQFGRDCRHLMRTEIGEVSQPRSADTVGSSTMAHKRNPTRYEQLDGSYIKVLAEFIKVLQVMISEHQRDLVNSSVMRDFPTIVVILVHALEGLTRISDKTGSSLITGTEIHSDVCLRNAELQAGQIGAEPLYIALQLAGYSGDAHSLVNEILMPRVEHGSAPNLTTALQQLLADDLPLALGNLSETVHRIPQQLWAAINDPLTSYTGLATEKALETVERAKMWLDHS